MLSCYCTRLYTESGYVTGLSSNARDRKCTHSTRNGHAHAYKARRVNVPWHVIIFRQLSWYGVPARQNRTQKQT